MHKNAPRRGRPTGKPTAAPYTPKGKIEDGKVPCAKCGVCHPTSQMNKVTSPRGVVKYICVRCLQ